MAQSKDQKQREEALVANSGDLTATTPPSPVDLEEKAKADKALDTKARKGDGPGATNEPR
jgi:hypothetical protein